MKRSLTFTLDLDEETFETLLLVRFLDRMTPEQFTLAVVMDALEKVRERGDYQAALHLKKHHQHNVRRLNDANLDTGDV